jgi:aminopeptidase N
MRRILLALLAPIGLAAQAPDSLLGPGVSLGLARYRAATVRDVRYDLRLDVTAPDSAVGRVIVSFARVAPNAEARAISGKDTGAVYLDFRGRRLTSIAVNGTSLPLSAYTGAHIRIPAAAFRRSPAAGRDSVTLAFATDIAPSGASIIKSHDPTDNSDYLYTLLVPADANQLFPTFDQPDLKARVTFHLTAPRAWRTLANGAESRADTAAATITHHFNETRPLSTYLIAFAAGPWEVASSTVDGRTVRLFARRSRFKEADTDSLLALNQRAITWMEEYFARPYPFEKFDLLLAPAFPFGGMEHPGAIFYNENSFIFRDRPTLARRIGRFSTILHEVAHQWFGDLVTMRWFDDLWLKEGFATYMAAKAQFALDSTTGAWKTFYQGNKPAAYAVDQTTGTNSLWQKLANLDQAKSNYGAIVYNKAPSVLKQLNYLVGEPGFQRGVRAFLDTHAYANATWQDLLAAISRTSGTPLVAFGQNFMLRPGMPVVEQRLTIRDGRIARLQLVQHPAQALSGTAAWPMRTQVLLSYGAGRPPVTLPVTMTGVITDVVAARGRPAPVFAFANHQDFGYFLTLLDSTSTANLEAGALGDVADPFLRTMLWGALWDQVRDARFDPARFARLALREIPREKDEQILPNLLGRLSRAVTTYVSGDARAALQPEIERALWAGASDVSRPFGIRRAYLDSFIGVASSADGVARLTALLSADSVAGDVIRDPTRWSIVDRLTVLDDPAAPRLLAAQTARDTTPDGRRRAFVAGAARKNADVKRDYFARYFGDRSLNEEWASGSLGAFNASEHAELTLPYLRPALDSLPFIQQNRRIFFLGNWLGAFIGGHRNAEALAIVQQYLADHPSLPLDLRQKVLQTVDELDRTVRIRRRWP